MARKNATVKTNLQMPVAERLFNALDVDSKGYILKKDLVQALNNCGILADDVRISQITEGLKKYSATNHIALNAFRFLVTPHITLIEKALTGGLVIPDFKNFASFITNLFNRTLQNKEGDVSGYIPELADVNPNHYALSVCTVDGQRFNIGDYTTKYLTSDIAKIFNYGLALKEKDEKVVHEHVGRSQKENGLDYLMLNQEGLPHNPLTESGSLAIASIIGDSVSKETRLARFMRLWKALSGGKTFGINEKAFTSEKKVSDADRTAAYFMRQKGLFKKGSNILEHLEFIWQCLSVETTTELQAVMAATLANTGICPTNEKEVLNPAITRNCLATMFMSGMKECSSEYAFSVGLPAISGKSGAVLICVPDVMGIVVWSPRIDKYGNSYKGLDFSHKLVERFNFHNFDSALHNVKKVDPRLKKNETKMKGVMAVTSAASVGDLDELQRLYAAGVDLNEGEYDRRTGLHLAASEGHLEVVKFLIAKGVDINCKDRWGGTPLVDAKREGHKNVYEFLKKHGGI